MNNFKRLALVVAVCVMVSGFFVLSTLAAGDYSFKVHNTTDALIKKILVSQDKKEWGEFDVGSGIKAGSVVTLVWDESANNESCKQYVKAVFADGSETDPAKFNFCEKGLELEF